MVKLTVAIGFLALNFYTYNFLASDPVIPARESFTDFPMTPGEGWECKRPQEIEPKVMGNLGVTDYLLCTFGNVELKQVVNVYVGYHASQVREEGGGAGENSIHPPAHCLPGSGWDIIRNESVPLDLPGIDAGGAKAKRLVIARGDRRQLVYYWYHSRGRILAEDWQKILYVGWDRAKRGRTDGSLVRFTMPVIDDLGGMERAESSFQSLAPLVVGRLPAYVPE